MHLEVTDPHFATLTLGNSSVERLWTGGRWVEGPVYFRDHSLFVWSDIPNDRLMFMHDGGETGIYRSSAGFINGNTRDTQGRLISCHHGLRCVVRTELDGTGTVLADSFDGKALNSPNDVVVHSSGSVWFSDPSYGILSDYEGGRRAQEQAGCYVYRIDPDSGELTAVVTDLEKPNGLAFSADESILYVADSEKSHNPDGAATIWAYDVVGGRTLARKRKLADVEPGVPDGFKVDEYDNVWTSTGEGVHCYSSDGRLLGKIILPEQASNLCFGGADSNRLYITAFTSVYAVYTNVRGASRP